MEYEMITKEFLQSELRRNNNIENQVVILDCRTSNEYLEGHIRSAVNLSIPSIMLRRLAAGKIDLFSTIKCNELKERIQNNYKLSLFVLYNNDNNSLNNSAATVADLNTITTTTTTSSATTTINVLHQLHRRLKQDGCRVVCLQDGFSSFRDAFPEWCEEENQQQNQEMNDSSLLSGTTQTDQLMGLRSLRISTPRSDSACSSSAESSDCESITHHNFNEAPVEIVPGLFLGNASHSGDSGALQKYNIKYVLNVTPDLPNVFEASGGIKYLQIPITDHYSQDLAIHFPVAIQFIEEARSKGSAVLVHCLAGVSRSVTVTLAYLMHTRSLCLNDAFLLVRDRKPDVSPNFHFMEQLHSFERQLQNQSPNLNLPSTSSSAACEQQQQQRTRLTATSTNIINSNNNINSNNCSTNSKFSCSCIEQQDCCKCMIESAVDFLSNTNNHHHHHHNIKITGVSPDSGIEFDRWTPQSSDSILK